MSANHKFLVPLADGLAVESVYYGSGTLCLSSQAGCAVGCPFCASGSRGLLRNLSVAELWAQVEAAHALGIKPRRLTLSGIGEPLHNFAAVREFLANCRSLNLPLSLTTTGSPTAHFRRMILLPHNGLMLSLHAGCAVTHRRLIPRGAELGDLLSVLEESLSGLSRRRRRKIGINYLLLAGINDSPAEFAELLPLFQRFPELTLHLLACNPVPESAFVSPDSAHVDELHVWLSAQGVNARRANAWRVQAEGGCGTLFAHRLGNSSDW
ncbi:radical SAM protein [Trichloromonas sp.]|uniref:radical SAM protein n=1 Tax=Trichloromonas sp. TaxID=3069249 RepID=UPI002A4AD6DC|nr:radical SAM protein [Trichloromonas sp.]